MNNLQAMRVVVEGLLQYDSADWEPALVRDIARTAFPRLLAVAEAVQQATESSVGKCPLCARRDHADECPMTAVLANWRGEERP